MIFMSSVIERVLLKYLIHTIIIWYLNLIKNYSVVNINMIDILTKDGEMYRFDPDTERIYKDKKNRA